MVRFRFGVVVVEDAFQRAGFDRDIGRSNDAV
jgi:hypothetical protein